MTISVERNKRKCKCKTCYKPIELKYRVNYYGSYYHLGCFKRWLDGRLDYFKKGSKELNKAKYKRQMILEGLEK